jgi:hypothetical protein
MLLLAAAVVALPVFVATAALPETAATGKAIDFIRGTQQADGGFGGFGPGQTWDAIYALRAGGYDPRFASASGKTTLDYLRANAATQTKPAAAAKAALAAKALGVDPKSVSGTNLIANVTAGLNATTGKYADDDFSQAVAILGLACTGNPVPGLAVEALKKSQLPDGGWGFGGASDADTTAIALQALAASGAGASDASVVKAIAALKKMQGSDGGWGFDPAASNASSTAYVVQALVAAGEQPESAAYTKSGKTPVSFLLSQQLPDGSFAGFDPVYAAIQAIPALAGRTFCNATDTPTTKPPLPAPTPPTATPPAAPTTAPLPPSTGTAAPAERERTATVAMVAGGILAAAGATFAVSRRRTR